jgi:pimeloyl-ACP methyl ester carboxylesterase
MTISFSYYSLLRTSLVFVLAASLSACVFSRLEDDLKIGDQRSTVYSGKVVVEGEGVDSLIVVASLQPDGSDIYAIRIMPGSGEFKYTSTDQPHYFFAFVDENLDLTFQADELFAFSGAVDSSTTDIQNLRLVVPDGTEPPVALVGLPLATMLGFQGKEQFSLGSIASFGDPRFSIEKANQGLWEPYSFLAEGIAGIYFLEPYDPKRIPVLFVHGISGTPDQFELLAAGLDSSRYQAWVYYYPSGLRLGDVSYGLYEFMETIDGVYGIDDIHVVAHSMGGLVARGALNYCALNFGCDYVRSFQSISTPWAGVASAKSGVEWAPTVVPVWRDIEPDSAYVQSLFDTALDDIPYYLFFGFKQSKLFAGDSSDGVISLSSQLRIDAQRESQRTLGLDRGHVEILEDPELLHELNNNLTTNK